MKQILFTFVLLLIPLSAILFFMTNESQVVHAPTVLQESEDSVDTPDGAIEADKSNLIRVASPLAQAVVGNPIIVSGEARGYWFFEGSFPLTVVDWDGRIIGEGYATAVGEWMTESFVPFSGVVTYTLPLDTPYKRGALIFRKDNPSGLPEHDDALEIPINFSDTQILQ